ncbi:MAG: hypothetical protein CMJ72_14745 [Planctomycetaceae bacterium]|nr:hypothetical protein [Planctomycetaceae bacterium]HCK41918.1 hypothetical protein [Planctomycetaceae bacterium]
MDCILPSGLPLTRLNLAVFEGLATCLWTLEDAPVTTNVFAKKRVRQIARIAGIGDCHSDSFRNTLQSVTKLIYVFYDLRLFKDYLENFLKNCTTEIRNHCISILGAKSMNNATKTASQAGMYLNRNMKDADKSLTKLESQIALLKRK